MSTGSADPGDCQRRAGKNQLNNPEKENRADEKTTEEIRQKGRPLGLKTQTTSVVLVLGRARDSLLNRSQNPVAAEHDRQQPSSPTHGSHVTLIPHARHTAVRCWCSTLCQSVMVTQIRRPNIRFTLQWSRPRYITSARQSPRPSPHPPSHIRRDTRLHIIF